MEVKAWEYDEYPGLTEEVEGAVHIPTTGDEPEFTTGMIFRMLRLTGINWFCRS